MLTGAPQILEKKDGDQRFLFHSFLGDKQFFCFSILLETPFKLLMSIDLATLGG